MTTNHIDQLTEWYESAERITKTNLPRSGDYVISPFFNGTGFHVELEPDDWPADIVREEREDARILSRAPKPKPAWVNARAIIAHTDGNPRPSVWTWHNSMDRWDDEGGCHWAYTEDLRDVTPLIEAKVTDEMVERAWAAVSGWPANTRSVVAEALTAALGLETE